MTARQYVVGLMVLAGMLLPAGVTAVATRRLLLPGWPRAPAAVAEAVAAIGTLVLVGELLGAFGGFERAPIVSVLVAVAFAALLAARRLAPRVAGIPLPPAPRVGFAPAVIAALAVAVVLVPWLQYALSALHDGMREFDTVTYHMPFAARFVQEASTTGLQYDGNAPVSFYPANSELVHALGIVAFHRDLLSPLINLAWLALALLAAWCIGRPTGTGPAAVTAVALVASLQVMVSSQAGTAKNDMMALALLLAAAALVTTAPRSRAAIGLAALAGGLAVGTRLNLWAPVLALAAVTLIGARRTARPALAGWLVLGGLAGGGFWYARNLAQVGNPVPWIGVKVGGLLTLHSTSKPADCGTRSVAHYAGRPGFVRAHLIPQLTESFGGRWWLVLALAAAGVAAGLLARGGPARGLAVVALLAGVAYLVTPATAGGADARCFAFNTRFAAPAVALGLIALPVALARWRVPPLAVVVVLAVALLVDVHVPFKAAPLAGSALLAGGAVAIAVARRRAVPPAAVVASIVCVVVAAAFAGWREQRIYLRERYTEPHLFEPVEPVAAALRHTRNARVAVTGFVETYPLLGEDLSSRIELPARRVDARFVPAAAGCRSWVAALERGRFDYVVTARQGTRDAPAAAWTRRIPGARPILVSPPGFTRRGVPWRWQLFRLDPARRVSACS